MNHLLLPNRFKWIGAILVFAGLAGLAFYLLFDFRIVLPVFAVFSSFLETKTFTSFQTNVADELILITLLAGFFFLVFAAEKTESEKVDLLRARAFMNAILANTVMLLFSVLFIYGNGFLAMILVNIFSIFIFYLVFFSLLKRGAGK